MNQLSKQNLREQENAVRDYLKQNPDFFDRNIDLLAHMDLSHPSGPAVSLIEKQVGVLRQRNSELRNKLNELLNNARENDRLFERTKRLVLALLECSELGDTLDAVDYSLDKEFAIPFQRTILFSERPVSCNARVMRLSEATPMLGEQLKSSRTCTGNLSRELIEFLFDRDARHVGSAAMAVFGLPTPLGVIAVGHPDTSHYQSSMGTLFLGHIAEVLGRLVAKYQR